MDSTTPFANGGIASLANGGMPGKRGLVDGPGGYAGDPADVAMDIYKRTGELFPEPESPVNMIDFSFLLSVDP